MQIKIKTISHKIICDIPSCGALAKLNVTCSDKDIYNFCGGCAKKIATALKDAEKGTENAEKKQR